MQNVFDREPWNVPVHMPEIIPPVEYIYEDMVYVLHDNFAEIVGYLGTWRTVRVPASLDGHLVIAIGSGAFMGNDTLRDVVIPGSIRRIGDYAFYRCPALQMAILMQGVATIGRNAFDECGMMRKIYTPRSIRQVGDDAFMDNARLRIMGSPQSAVQEYCDRKGLLLIPHNPGDYTE